MGKATFDLSFVRRERPLIEWLPELVADEWEQRLAAANALGGMWSGLPSYDTRGEDIQVQGSIPDLSAHARLFADEVRRAVASPGFPQEVFVRRLILYRMSLNADRLKRVNRMSHEHEAYDRRETALIERALTSPDAGERERAAKRFTRLFCASLARDNRITSESESMQAPGMISHLVFTAMGRELLVAADLLGQMLESRLAHEALDALERAGPAARSFAPRLMNWLDRPERFDAAAALGSIARDDAELADELLARLRSGTEIVQARVMAVLEHAGPRLAGRESEAIELLLPMTHRQSQVLSAVPALASVGRDRRQVLQRLVEIASPRPPRTRVIGAGQRWEGEIDEVMYERGVAISALRYLTAFPDEVVTVLAEAIESFVEYDPDESYFAEHGRVCGVLEAFGPSAAPAVPALVAYLEHWVAAPAAGREFPRYVLDALRAIGPVAADAEPVLRRLRRAGQDQPPDELDPDDPVDATILALRLSDAPRRQV